MKSHECKLHLWIRERKQTYFARQDRQALSARHTWLATHHFSATVALPMSQKYVTEMRRVERVHYKADLLSSRLLLEHLCISGSKKIVENFIGVSIFFSSASRVENVTHSYPTGACAGTTSLKFSRFDRRNMTTLTGDLRTFAFFCEDPGMILSLSALIIISERSWGGLFYRRISSESSPKRTFLVQLFDIHRVCDSSHCTGGELALCAVCRRWLKLPLSPI